MKFSDQPPSKHWAALKFRGAPFAEVWFKPEGEPLGLLLRIPQASFLLPDLASRLTADNLLRAVGVDPADVESCLLDGAPAPAEPLAAPPDVAHLTLHVTLKPPAPEPTPEADVDEVRWQELEARWNIILGIEASIDTLRISMESLRAEMEAASRRALSSEEKLHAYNADVAQWNKAKSRVTYALPKVRDYIHRSTWAAGTPERKALEERIKNFVLKRIPFPELGKMMEQLDYLLKDRQVLSAHGVTVYQECRSVAGDLQSALSNLQNNARNNGIKKRAQTVAKGKIL